MDFIEALERLGFRPAEERSLTAAKQYRANPNAFLTYWVHVYEDGTALFTWEFAIVDYLAQFDIQVGSSEALNLYMFPGKDERGPQDPVWLAEVLGKADETLRSLRFHLPEGDPGD